jgi:hypothetical protein
MNQAKTYRMKGQIKMSKEMNLPKIALGTWSWSVGAAG